jgi:hypothetical protein
VERSIRTQEGMNMTPLIEDDLTDQQFEINMQALELSIVGYTRTIGAQLNLSEQTQSACMKRALMTVLLDMIEHVPCDLARSEILEELATVWNRRVAMMMDRSVPAPTAH